jgi:hypothetical protein
MKVTHIEEWTAEEYISWQPRHNFMQQYYRDEGSSRLLMYGEMWADETQRSGFQILKWLLPPDDGPGTYGGPSQEHIDHHRKFQKPTKSANKLQQHVSHNQPNTSDNFENKLNCSNLLSNEVSAFSSTLSQRMLSN